MKVLVTGAVGQLGSDVVQELKKRNIEVIATDVRGDVDDFLDITNINEVKMVLHQEKPDAIIHPAAWTNVDGAEDIENKQKVYEINVLGTRNIAKIAKEIDAKVLYISTDYVFEGSGKTPHKPDDKNFGPESYYGQTKLEGEKEIIANLEKFFIVRIAWAFGENGNNFVKTMLRLSETHDSLTVVDDQIGTPTYTKDLARLLVDIISSDKYGYYHATNSGGYISWATFAKEIFAQAKRNTNVIPISTADYLASKAKRPLNSRLDKSKLKENGFKPLPSWKNALHRYLINEGIITKDE